MKHRLEIQLDSDTAEFLEATHKTCNPETVSQYLNSLIRQERFRQGYFAKALPEKPLVAIPTPSRLLSRCRDHSRGIHHLKLVE